MRKRKLQFLLGYTVLFLLAAGCAAYLYVQLGPDCARIDPKVAISKACSCKGFEYVRSGARGRDDHYSSVCFGVIADRWTNFSSWDAKSLDHADRLTIRSGNTTLRDTTEGRSIRPAGLVFENLKEGWRTTPQALPQPQYLFVFTNYAPDANGEVGKKEIWFGLADDAVQTEGGFYRRLSAEEKNSVQRLLRP